MSGKRGKDGNVADPCNLALDLHNEAITLYRRSESGDWLALGKAVLGADDFSDQIDALRVEVLVRGGENQTILLWLPPEQVIAREMVLAPGSEDAARNEATQKIATATEFDPSELIVAMAPATDASSTIVLGALRQTVHEAKTYATKWGFPRTIVSTRRTDGQFGLYGPSFEPPPTMVRQAGHAVRRLAVAASIFIAIGGALYGGYNALQPLLEEPRDIRSLGPAVASFTVVLDPLQPETTKVREDRNRESKFLGDSKTVAS